MRRDGDEAVAQVCLGAAFEGAPGRAHGGVVAAVFDAIPPERLGLPAESAGLKPADLLKSPKSTS